MSNSDSRDQLVKIVDECAAKIREHCDSVQIFATLHEDDRASTITYEKGFGNFYARQGQIQEWLTMQQQFQKNYAIRKDQEDE